MANVFQLRKAEVEKILKERDPWEWGTFEGARRRTLYEGFLTTFAEKVKWLEEAEDLAIMMRRSSEKNTKTSK